MAARPFWSEWREPWVCGLIISNHAQHGLGKSGLPLPVAEEGRLLFAQRSKNTRNCVSPKCFSPSRKPARSDEAASSETLVNTLIFAVSRKAKMQASLATPTAVRTLILIDQSLFFSSHIVSGLV